jgi:hypothetical protein
MFATHKSFSSFYLACVLKWSDQCPDRGNHRARRLKMKNFTIENETNNITVHASAKEAETVPNSERFGSEAALTKLAANWPAARLVEIWNGLPGATAVQKFKDRPTGVSRIWKAIQSLGDAAPDPEAAHNAEVPEEAPVPDDESATAPSAAVTAETPEPAVVTPVAPQLPDVATVPASETKRAARKEKAQKAPKTATEHGPREGSKTSQVIAMLKRESGTTLEEIMAAMDWQKHTTRAMLSAGGSLTKKHGLVIVSEKVGEKRVFSIKA